MEVLGWFNGVGSYVVFRTCAIPCACLFYFKARGVKENPHIYDVN